MEKTLGKEYTSASKRKAYLCDNCDSVVEKRYMKPFAPGKMQEMKERLAEASIEIGELEEAKKASAAAFNTELKPLLDERSELLGNIKHKAENVKEECFKFVDQEEKMVGFYNCDGDLIESRPANPDELQMTIQQSFRNLPADKTGTDN